MPVHPHNSSIFSRPRITLESNAGHHTSRIAFARVVEHHRFSQLVAMDATRSPLAGFAAVLTPPASSVAPSSQASPLPQPRRHPLKPGSSKESDVIIYLDNSLNNVQKRVENRLQDEEDHYSSFAEVERDLTGLVDVVWVSGSRMHIPPARYSHASRTFVHWFPYADTSAQPTSKYPTF